MDGMVQVGDPQPETTSAAVHVAEDFHALLVALLPKLRIQALALARNRPAAEDLVQDAVANALAAQESFTPGTNFAAWMHRILRNDAEIRYLTEPWLSELDRKFMDEERRVH
jgi:RNA polymerase sigma-70 factor (ECF subfamily)